MTSRHLLRHGAWRLVLAGLWLLLAVLPGSTQPRSNEPVTGDWQQLVFARGAWRTLGVFRVLQSGAEYRMEPVNQVRDGTVINSRGLSNVRFSDPDWRFHSDWGNGNVAEFRLRRIGPGAYQGWSYLRDEQRELNLWLLVRPSDDSASQSR